MNSLSRVIGEFTEKAIDEIILAYGKTPTDTILAVLGFPDNSGYIPAELFEKLTEEDCSSDIGKESMAKYEEFKKFMKNLKEDFVAINLCSDELMISIVNKRDTMLLCDVLKEHKGYKVLGFLAAWYAPCRVFNRSFQEKYKEYKNQGVELYGIGIKAYEEVENEKFMTAVQRDDTPWRQFIDIGDSIYSKFNTGVVPIQVLLDGENNIVKMLSFDIEKDLDEVLEKP